MSDIYMRLISTCENNARRTTGSSRNALMVLKADVCVEAAECIAAISDARDRLTVWMFDAVVIYTHSNKKYSYPYVEFIETIEAKRKAYNRG